MATSTLRVLGALAFAVLLVSCTVDDSSLDTALFPCATDSNCGDGWGCKRATPYSVDFCAARCVPGDTATCDGICTKDNLCLTGCQLYDDGTSSACPGPDYACVRTSVQSNNGVCYPVTVCALDTDCPAGTACLSVGFGIDRLYCVPSAVSEPCAPGSVSTAAFFGGTAPYCFPTCMDGGESDLCPPGFGCLHQVSLFSRVDPLPAPCVPGAAGVSCDDDSNCLFGRCLDTAPSAVGKICTISCNEASRQFGAAGCAGLSLGGGFDELFKMECDTAAAGGADGGLCSVRYAIGWPACTPAGMAYPCVTDPPGTMCMPFDIDGMHYDICTRACTTSAECNGPRGNRNFCAAPMPGSPGICYPRGQTGDACTTDEGCRSNSCVGAVPGTPGACA